MNLLLINLITQVNKLEKNANIQIQKQDEMENLFSKQQNLLKENPDKPYPDSNGIVNVSTISNEGI